MTKTLTIKTQDGWRIARLVWRNGTVFLECSSKIGLDVDRWIRDGVNEWVGARDGEVYGHDAVKRHTPSYKEEFLPRLGGYLQRHFGFATTLESEEAREGEDV